jgi:excisionase family DNA binding protein
MIWNSEMKKKKIIDLIKIVLRDELTLFNTTHNNPVQSEKILSRRQVMLMLCISSTKLWQMVKANEIKHTRVGRQLRFLESDVMDMLQQK